MYGQNQFNPNDFNNNLTDEQREQQQWAQMQQNQ